MPRQRGLGVAVGLWWAVCALAIGVVLARGLATPAGDPWSALPAADRPDAALLVLIEAEGAPSEGLWPDVAARLRDTLADAVVPLAPPAAERDAWLDTHALLLLPVEAHAALAVALRDDAIQAAVAGLRARMGSPLFGVSDEEPRRDPLGLREVARRQRGGMIAARRGPADAVATATGDLLAARGAALLVGLDGARAADVLAQVAADAPPRAGTSSGTPPGGAGRSAGTLDGAALAAIEAALARALAGLDVRATLLGAPVYARAEAQMLAARGPELALTTAAALVLVLALALRRTRVTLALAVMLASALALAFAGLAAVGVALTPASAAMLVLLAGCGCDAALSLQRLSAKGWAAVAILATALAPMLASPYPGWRTWAWAWAVGVTAIAVALRLVLPATLRLLGTSLPREQRGGLRLQPWPWLAVLGASFLLAMGSLRVRDVPSAPIRLLGAAEAPALAAADRTLRREFFDPGLRAWVDVEGSDAAQALDRAVGEARELAAWVPAHAVGVTTAAALIVPAEELQPRRAGLAALGLAARMVQVEAALRQAGLRPDAFGEFLRTVGDETPLPSAAELLTGPLGPWARRSLVVPPGNATPAANVEPGAAAGTSASAVATRVIVDLRPGDDPWIEGLAAQASAGARLRGPPVAAARERAALADRLGTWSALGMVLGGGIVALATRSPAIAVASALAALISQAALLWAMAALGLPLGAGNAGVVPLVGTLGILAGGRACRAVDLREPLAPSAWLVNALCQIGAAAALVLSGQPLWLALGLPVAVGAAIASAVGLFIAPGLCAVLRRAAGVGRTPAPPGSDPERGSAP